MKYSTKIPVLTACNGFIIGLFFLFMRLDPSRTLWPFIAFVVLVTFMLNGYFSGSMVLHQPPDNKMVKITLLVFISFTFIYLVRQLFQDIQIFKSTDRGSILAFDYFFNNCGLFLILAAIFFGRGVTSQIMRIISVVIGIGIWAGVNLLMDLLDLSLSGKQADISFGDSRFGFVSYRWYPPLVESVWGFAAICSIVTVVGLVLLVRSFGRQGVFWNFWLRGLVLIAIGAALVAAFRCQFRTHSIVLLLALFWLICGKLKRVKILAMNMLFVAFIVAPLILSGTRGESFLDIIHLDEILKAAGSKTSEALTLSGRTELHDAGLEKLQDPLTFLIGQGPSLRDSGLVTSLDSGAARRGYQYHSGFLDMLLSHGTLLSLAFSTALIICLQYIIRIYRSGKYSTDVVAQIDATLLYFCSWLTLSISDGGFFSYFDSFALAFVPLFGALRVAVYQLPRNKIN